MVTYPILVNYANRINYAEQPRLALSSLLLECGYLQAELFVQALAEVVATDSIFSFLSLYTHVGSLGTAAALTAFNLALGHRNKPQLISTLQSLVPRYNYGWPSLESSLQGITYSNYKNLLDWLSYPYIDVYSLVDQPMSLLTWLESVDNSLIQTNNYFRAGNLYAFIASVLLSKTGVNLTTKPKLRLAVKQWTSICFADYAFGSTVDQSLRWWEVS